MAKTRTNQMWPLIIGLLISIVFTFLGMLLISILLVYAGVKDSMLVVLNQALKILAVAIGTYFAVPRGSENGLMRGTILSLVYMALGYIFYIALGGDFNFGGLLGELLLGCATGAIVGAVRANLSPRRARKAH